MSDVVFEIDNINMIKFTATSNNLPAKRSMCIWINRQVKNSKNMLEWDKGAPFAKKIVYKPQYIHSAAAIYTLLKYPQLRSDDSFILLAINSKLEDECLKIATDVLLADKDCINFITYSDSIFNGEIDVFDPIYNTMVSCKK